MDTQCFSSWVLLNEELSLSFTQFYLIWRILTPWWPHSIAKKNKDCIWHWLGAPKLSSYYWQWKIKHFCTSLCRIVVKYRNTYKHCENLGCMKSTPILSISIHTCELKSMLHDLKYWSQFYQNTVKEKSSQRELFLRSINQLFRYAKVTK